MQKVSQYSPIIWECEHPLTVTIYGTQAERGIAELIDNTDVEDLGNIVSYCSSIVQFVTCSCLIKDSAVVSCQLTSGTRHTERGEHQLQTHWQTTCGLTLSDVRTTVLRGKICALVRSTGPPSKSSFISATLILRDSWNLQSHCVFKKIWDKDGREPSTRQTCVLPDWKNWNPTMYKTPISHWN